MRLTLASLNQVQQTSASLRKSQIIPTHLESPPVKNKMQYLTEMTFIYILKLLGVEDEEKLSEIVSRLKEGTPFYDFTVLAHNLAKSKTDFEFLSSPENLPAYAKIAEVSKECGVVLLPYVNVLARIAENKQYGLYSENQEVTFFLDEYGKYKDMVDAKEFLHQFRKILKYRTQKIFEQFINDGIFTIIRETLTENSGKISTTQTLALFVYCLHYYQNDISNDDENFLHEHIRFCVDYLAIHEKLNFTLFQKSKFLPEFDSHEKAVEYFFYYFGILNIDVNSFIGLLKDFFPNEDVYDFCDFLKENLCKNTDSVYNGSKSELIRLITRKIREKSEAENIQLYKDICKLLPKKIVCQCTPHGVENYIFLDKRGTYLFSAPVTGNQNPKRPPINTPIEIEILQREGKHGRVITWNWN